MDGSKEDGQVDCTRKPYWGAAKKACNIDQYGALPMDGSKGGQAGAPAIVAVAQRPVVPVTVLAGVPTVAAASKGPVAPAAGPARALVPAVRKRRPAGGWPAAKPTGAPTMVAAFKEPTAPAAGPVGALESATIKGGLAEGWGHTVAVALMMVPARAPTAETSPMMHSREAGPAA
jgi:hypothetical protein